MKTIVAIINFLSNMEPIQWFILISILIIFGLFTSAVICVMNIGKDIGSGGDPNFKVKVSPFFFK